MVLGAVVALDPGGFWRGWERHVFFGSIWASIRAVRALQPLMPAIASSRIGRTLLLAQFSARPWRLAPSVVLDEMRTYAASPVFDELLDELAHGRTQEGAPAGSIRSPLFIGWGRQDRICLPRQAARAVAMFPDAKLQWFEHCGHFPHWDAPEATTRLILRQEVVAQEERPDRGFPAVAWWTRLQPIRTASEVPLEFAVFTHEPFVYQRVGPEVRRMRNLGMTLEAIGRAVGVDEKTVRKILLIGTT